jgi:predicted amidohydrolase YtcJ
MEPARPTSGRPTIDLGGAYLLPGLWDVHIHPDYLAETGASVVDQTIAFGQRLMALTEAAS